MPKTIAVIGAGASGTLACAHLLAHPSSAGVRIEWVGNEADFGPGLAFGTKDPGHLLNVRAQGMSAFPDNPMHFVEWARLGHPQAAPTDFLPRMGYGEYLRTLVPQTEARVCRHHDEAIRVTPAAEGGYLITLRSGRKIEANQVIIAIGNLQGPSGFGADAPWRPSEIAGDARVLLIGTGLTMLDAAITLCRGGRKSPVWAVSRRGLLPQVHRSYAAHVPTPAFADLLRAQNVRLARAFRVFRAECEIALAQGSDWRAVFDLIRPHTPRIWSQLSERDRKRFLRHAVRYWDIHRHCIAPEIAEQIAGFRARGLLVVCGARIDGLRRTPAGTWELRIEKKDGGFAQAEFDVVLDCSGLIKNIKSTSSALLQALLEDGLFELDHPLLGAHPSASQPGLHVIGPLLRGAYWESIAIPEIRFQARDLAQRVLAAGAK